jgi:small GTP-binding protein
MSNLAQSPSRKVKTLKAVLVGDSTVGKTSILTVANTGQFEAGAAPTVGACFVANNYTFSDHSVRLNIWDTAGQERYRALAPMYYHDMDIGCIVYAIDSSQSFEAVESWYEGIVSQVSQRPAIYLIGNKQDLAKHRKVTEEMGTELAEKIGAQFREVSALTNCTEITDLFREMAREASDKLNTTPKPQPTLQEERTAEKSQCC